MSKVLLLTITDQSKTELNEFLDVHCNYDFTNWQIGLSSIHNVELNSFNFLEFFVNNGLNALQEKLLLLCKEIKYDYLILPTMYYEITIDTLDIIKNLGTKIVICFFDDSMRFSNYNIYYCQVADYIITHESKNSLMHYDAVGYKANFFPNLPSYNFYKKLAIYKKDLEYDVVFVGANIANRKMYYDNLIQEFKNTDIKIGFFGKNWANGYVDTDTMLSLFKSSKIVLNFTKTIDNKGNDQLKGRMFEICMAEGFLLTEYFEEIESYYNLDEEIVSFSNSQDLIEKIKYYLFNNLKRESIRMHGYIKTQKLHSFEYHWENFFLSIENNSEKKNTLKTINVTREHKLNFLMWNISLINANVYIKKLKYAEEFLYNITNSKYYTKELIAFISKDISILNVRGIYSKLRILVGKS